MMKIFESKFLGSLCLIFILFILGLSVGKAQQSPLRSSCNGPDCTWCNFFSDIKRWLDFFVLKITLPAAGLLIIISGLLYMLSGSSRMLSERGKNILTYTFLGILIIFSSWTIVSLIMKLLLRNPDLNPWSGISC